ncbi:hypothetical protein C6Y14_41495 [Streptomyces dioscori]|uniref:Secreted protein n=1 Tax=Streptomyces dioscori TaxID=2109333 RepID=A0A2P8PU46_9ACTN|nr:hypothetical protein [Streptomyces dioscori]PSM37512.1 hypothetical protein C6Y14_41495 [Streptomyces dioscori]
MRRGTTVRTLFAVLAAVLLALQLSATTTTFAPAFASAHTPRLAGPGEGTWHVPEARAEFVTCGDTSHSHGPTGPLRTRDRIRVADHVAPAAARLLLCKDVAAVHEDPSHTAAPAAHHRTTRSSGAHSSAALQVFRC